MKLYKFILSLFFYLTLTNVTGMAKISKLYETEKTKTVVNRHSTKKSTSYLISGTVEKTTAYCGGAKPSQDLLNKLAKPSSYANKKFYIRTGKVNSMAAKIVKNFTTDSAGVFSIRLKPGIYSIIVEEQLHPIKPDEYANQNQEVDVKCLEEWWAKPYYLLIVKNKNISQLNFVFHHRCFISCDIPCITYRGPMPP